MIEYDYTMKKFYGNECNEYRPSFKTGITNVSKLRGHNSSGKTTLMDMIALSLFGYDSPDVIPKLREKLQYLKESKNTEFEFKMQVNNGKKYLRIKTRKSGYFQNSPEWESTVDESTDGGITYSSLLKENFSKQYRVIYDMPDRPMERIQELVRGVYMELSSDLRNLDSFRYALWNTIDHVEKSRDECYIKKLEEDIYSQNSKIETAENEKDNCEVIVDNLSKYIVAIELERAQERSRRLKSRLSDIKNFNKEMETRNTNENNSYEKNRCEIFRQLEGMMEKYKHTLTNRECISKIDKDLLSQYISFWGESSIDDIMDEECSRLPDYRKISSDLIQKIDICYGSSQNGITLDKKNMIKNILSILEPFCEKSISILDTPINDLYAKLEEECDELQLIINEFEKANKCKEEISSSSEIANDAYHKFLRLGRKPEGVLYHPDYCDVNEQLEDAKRNLNEAKKNAEKHGVTPGNYRMILSKARGGVDLRQYGSNIEMLKSSLNEMCHDLDLKKEKVANLCNLKSRTEKELEEAKSKEPHPFSNYLKELKELRSEIEDNMLSSLKKKGDMLCMLSEGRHVGVAEDNVKFLKDVWKYLGKKLRTIQHVGKTYDVDEIDMNRKEVVSGDVRINFKDMGTGESQMAYLMGLLNTDDPRTIIALFDEVDHMDPGIISKIESRLKELLDSGRLIIGLMAAPGSGTEVDCCE